MQPYFSVIIPVYNVASYLERCIQSVLAQSFSDYEIILVDDGSTDESPRICDQYAVQEKISVIHKENGGLSSARNAGFASASGRYIWYVDSDDWIGEDALEKLYQASCCDTPDIVKFSYNRIEEELQSVITAVEPGMYKASEEIEHLLDKAFYSAGSFLLSAWSHIYRKAFLDETGVSFVSERIIGSEDYLYNLEVFARAASVRVLAEPLYYYELRIGSLTQKYKSDLPLRYTRLYSMLMEAYRRIGLLEMYRGRIQYFYIWHLLRGTCIPNEYGVTGEHSLEEGRRNIIRFLSLPEFRSAARECGSAAFKGKNKILFWALKHKCEPLFYYLYVLKPGLVEGKRCMHENPEK